MSGITLRLAAQNVGRRPARTLLLVIAVALAVGVAFAAYVIGWSVRTAMAQSEARAGADLLVVPREALVNLTQSLLTVQPTDATLDAGVVARIAATEGVARVSRQRLVRAEIDGKAGTLIAFDPATDFTVQPWLRERGGGSVGIDAVLAGARTPVSSNGSLRVCGQPLVVQARLRPSGVGPFDEAHFVSFAGLDRLAALCARDGPRAQLHDAGCAFERLDESTAVLVRLAPDARSEAVALALSQIQGIKVVDGNAYARAAREAVRMLLAAIGALAIVAVASLVVLVSLLFSAIVHERQREIGLLRAIGAGPGQVIGVILAEASLVTGAGGAFGVVLGGALLSAYARTLGFHLEALGIPLAWPPVATVVAAAGVAVIVSAALGVAGAFVPAWRSQQRDPHALLGGAS